LLDSWESFQNIVPKKGIPKHAHDKLSKKKTLPKNQNIRSLEDLYYMQKSITKDVKY
jgi:hypothetical protein